MDKTIYFLLNLLQDLYILRKLIFLFNDDTDYKVEILVTKGFIKRDKDFALTKEIKNIEQEIGINVFYINSNIEIYNKFNNVLKAILISSSESTLDAHAETSNLMKLCKSNIKSITIQHGFECVGFLHNKNHSLHHGSNVGFNADIVCGWIKKEYQRDLINSSKSKYCFLGNPAFINKTSKRTFHKLNRQNHRKNKPGLICENIHSARFNNSDKARDQFLNNFLELAELLNSEGKKIAIRPHPAGRFKKSVTKNPKTFPKNVLIDNSPSHLIDWSSYGYGISAPSSVVFDMFLSGIPVCIWSDANQSVDISLLRSFPIATSVEELFSFCLYFDNLPENNYSDQIKSMLGCVNEEKIGIDYLSLINSILC
ncbi:hypothetical protein [uncultured Prochlorococcus sp.]|uniref:hypothetical protein n=1 Tax=uncultured Prochlorococcus sp. TaxID=159733 RepID=UPI0025844FF8|nr:hypothetical protein [uncultured Prochlorococcus sp.]